MKHVELITRDDIDYKKWIITRNNAHSINPAAIRRQQYRNNYPDLFEKIANTWNSYEFIAEFHGILRFCRNCRHSGRDKYDTTKMICWSGWTHGRPKQITAEMCCNSWIHNRISRNDNTTMIYDKVPYFFRFVCDQYRKDMQIPDQDNVLNGGNIRAHLKDMGILLDGSDDKKSGWQQAKDKERLFLSTINKVYSGKNIPIQFIFLPHIFKINKIDNFIAFKEMDAFLTFKNTYILIEYKSNGYDKDSVQITDYMRLLEISKYLTPEQIQNTFVFCVCNYISEYSDQKNTSLQDISRWNKINLVNEKRFHEWVLRYFL